MSADGSRLGVVDYLCNAFTPDRRDVWDAAIGTTGNKVKIRNDTDGDGFAEPDEMMARAFRRPRGRGSRARDGGGARDAGSAYGVLGGGTARTHPQLGPPPRPRRLLPALRVGGRDGRGGRRAGGDVGRAHGQRVRPPDHTRPRRALLRRHPVRPLPPRMA